MKKFCLVFATAMLFASSSLAGGPGWIVEVVAIERIDASHAILKLRNVSDQVYHPLQVCDPLVVTADYKGELWPKTWSERVTEDVHSLALDATTEKYEQGQTFMFGYIGTGLVHESVRSTCHVITRGLMFEPSTGLIAFHDRT